jgi:galactokinase
MNAFETLFQMPEQATDSAPGRVNLMGEHTDYNQGFVLPTILPDRTTVRLAIATDNDEQLDAFSAHYQERIRCSFAAQFTGHWINYILACIQQLCKRGITVPNLKLFVESTVPIGAGVASSAALEVAVLKAMRTLLKLNLTELEIAAIAQQAESEGVGMPCGIMDQMVASLGQPHQAFFLDTQDLSFEQIPLPANYRFAVVHSGKTHALVEGSYKQRRQECERTAALLNVSSLREIDFSRLESSKHLPETLWKRAKHVVTENQRVLDSVAALRANRIVDFGALMNASHLSQKQDFAVTIPETDDLWEVALKYGAIGARQTGGGFGGAIVALIPDGAVQKWWDCVSKACVNASLICVI